MFRCIWELRVFTTTLKPAAPWFRDPEPRALEGFCVEGCNEPSYCLENLGSCLTVSRLLDVFPQEY